MSGAVLHWSGHVLSSARNLHLHLPDFVFPVWPKVGRCYPWLVFSQRDVCPNHRPQCTEGSCGPVMGEPAILNDLRTAVSILQGMEWGSWKGREGSLVCRSHALAFFPLLRTPLITRTEASQRKEIRHGLTLLLQFMSS